jgi:hypothetical protein
MASSSDLTEEMHSLLLSIQRDPTKAGAALPSLSKPELLQLFGLFVNDDPELDMKASKSQVKNSLRASAYVALSSYITSVRTSPPTSTQEGSPVATDALTKAFAPAIEDALRGTNISHLSSTLAFLSALFQVDPQTAVAVLIRDGNIECIADIIDMSGLSMRGAGIGSLRRELATFLSHAAGHTPCRKALVQPDLGTGDGKIKRWLESVLDGGAEGKDRRTQAAAALALVKLYQGSLQDAEADTQGQQDSRVESSDEEIGLAKLMGKMLLAEISTSKPSSRIPLHKSLLDAIEGLAYLSVHSSVKAHIASSPSLINALLKIALVSTSQGVAGTKNAASLSSTAANRESATKSSNTDKTDPNQLDDPRVNVGLHYGLALLFANLCQYTPRLGKEEEQIAKLRSLGKPSNPKPTEEDPNMTDEAVRERITTLVKAGLLPVLAGLARSESGSARACVAKVYAATIEDGRGEKKAGKESNLRGNMLANGGGKALLGIIKAGSGFGKGKSLEEVPNWIAIQALSKLAITSSPLQVFGPDLGTTFDVIPVFSSVLTYAGTVSSSSSTPLHKTPGGTDEPNDLQRFEALMALTNLASLGEEVANRVVGTRGLWEALESGLLEEGHGGLMRRASAELMCNLVVCEKGFEMFVPPLNEDGTKSRQESRLHLLVALSDVEDLPTRKATSGALAMLTSDERVCIGLARLQKERGTTLGILGRLLVDEVEEGE